MLNLSSNPLKISSYSLLSSFSSVIAIGVGIAVGIGAWYWFNGKEAPSVSDAIDESYVSVEGEL